MEHESILNCSVRTIAIGIMILIYTFKIIYTLSFSNYLFVCYSCWIATIMINHREHAGMHQSCYMHGKCTLQQLQVQVYISRKLYIVTRDKMGGGWGGGFYTVLVKEKGEV